MVKSTSCTPTAYQITNPSARLTCSIGAVLETYGYENVTSKVNAGCFKLYDAYSTSFNSSKGLQTFLELISVLKDCIKVQEKKKKVVVSCSSPRQNVELGTFTS